MLLTPHGERRLVARSDRVGSLGADLPGPGGLPGRFRVRSLQPGDGATPKIVSPDAAGQSFGGPIRGELPPGRPAGTGQEDL